MFSTAIAGSLPKPAWLAETEKLWPRWKAEGLELAQAKLDATLLWIKAQEDAGLDVIGDGEQSRQHFVHGFLEQVEGIDFEHKVEMGIRNDRYKAMVPQVVAPLKLKGRVHATEARFLRANTARRIKFTLPGPMTIVDTVADRFYGDRVKMAMAFAELLNEEALALQADGVDVIQFDEPAFNVYMAEAADWGVQALERAAQGLTCTTAVHICYGYGIQANIDWKKTLGTEWRQYEKVFPALAASSIDQVSLECIHSQVPAELMALLKGKDVMVGVIDVANEQVETPEEVADTIGRALEFVPRQHLIACKLETGESSEARIVPLAPHCTHDADLHWPHPTRCNAFPVAFHDYWGQAARAIAPMQERSDTPRTLRPAHCAARPKSVLREN
jgi:5-methyltetrahydropteroyltriglutamate--homocysteine methyltransferase